MNRKRGALAIFAMALGAATAITGAAPAADKPDYRGMTATVLQQLGTGPKTAKAPQSAEDTEQFLDTITDLVERAKAEGRSDAYVNDLISEATEDGDLAVPEGLRTSTGEVDTTTLLATIVARAAAKEDAYAAALATEAASGSSAGGAKTVTAPAASDEPVIHVVESGDSLAAIALKYYSDALAYPRILDANRDRIRRADLILVGQRLVIPR